MIFSCIYQFYVVYLQRKLTFLTLIKITIMRYILFGIGLLCWFAFAYDIENDRDFMTWIWLLTSKFFFVNSYVRYKHDMKQKDK